MDERSAYITLNMMPQVGPVSVRVLAQKLGSVSNILSADKEELLTVRGVPLPVINTILEKKDGIDPLEEESNALKQGIKIVTYVDSEYPFLLKQIHDPPLALYVKGELCETDRKAIAIVGTRHPTHYGRTVAEKLSMQVAAAGFTVVSGLASGVDTAAHRGALNFKGGRTIAVLGGAIDCLYPPENEILADEIARHGAVITEYPLGRQPDKTTFPVRNRIISGLSMGVIVVEATRQSGAMITASQALSQGRQVFAVPGRIDNIQSSGCHELLKNGAILTTSVDDILEAFEFIIPRREIEQQTELLSEKDKIILDVLSEGEKDVDQLIRASGMSPSEINVALLSLEMRHLIHVLPGRRVARV